MKNLKDNADRSKKLTEILKVSLWFNIAFLPIYVWQYFIYSKYNFDPLLESWEFYPEGYDEPTFDFALGITSIIYFVVYIICIVRFIKWFRRAYFNIEAAGLNIDKSESTAAWSWFVPIYNLFAPYQIMKEVWLKTQKAYTENIKPINDLIGLWWGTWVIASIIEGQIDGIGPSLLEGDLEGVAILGIISSAVIVLSNYLVIEVVEKVSVFEKAMYSTHSLPTSKAISKLSDKTVF